MTDVILTLIDKRVITNKYQSVQPIERINKCSSSTSSICCGFVLQRTDATTVGCRQGEIHNKCTTRQFYYNTYNKSAANTTF